MPFYTPAFCRKSSTVLYGDLEIVKNPCVRKLALGRALRRLCKYLTTSKCMWMSSYGFTLKHE